MKINHFNFKKQSNNDYLVTTDFGTFCSLTNDEFIQVINKTLTKDSAKYEELVDKGIIYENEFDFIEDFTYLLRRSKNCLFTATSLFIFVVTTKCNGDCLYCQAKTSNSHGLDMDEKTADKYIDILMECPSKNINVEFQGGEPLLNFKIIKYIVSKINNLNIDKNIRYSLVSNLTLVDDEIISFIKANKIGVSSSLDGDSMVHDYNRPMKDKTSMFNRTKDGVLKLKSNGIKAEFIQTTTRFSLDKQKNIIDEYISNNSNYIFLRPLTPVGMAEERWNTIGYTPDEFLKFYCSSLDYIIDINLGGYLLKEGMATIFLEKILNNRDTNYMELRSPCGASIGQMAFYPTGDIFSCDEGRMLYEYGDDIFKIGDKHSSYSEILNSRKCKSISSVSLLESLPECGGCIYSPYCGVCPVINYALYKDVFPNIPNHYKCLINRGILNKLFSILLDKKNDRKKVLYNWVGHEE